MTLIVDQITDMINAGVPIEQINQFKKVLIDKEVNKNIFNCNNSTHIIAELFYILANVLSSQEDYKLSNFYINIAKFLNPKFKYNLSLVAFVGVGGGLISSPLSSIGLKTKSDT